MMDHRDKDQSLNLIASLQNGPENLLPQPQHRGFSLPHFHFPPGSTIKKKKTKKPKDLVY